MSAKPASTPDISVVLPAFNEDAVIEQSLSVVRAELEQTDQTFEIVCVDDGSADRTLELLYALQQADPRIVVVALSRNFGKESALAAGMNAASGRAVLFMDSDLQHPPEVIPRMVALWKQGYDVVNGVKEQRGRETFLYRGFVRIFNALMGSAARATFRGASDFKLLDRQVIDALLELTEYNRFFRGLVAWVGFRTTSVAFRVAERAGGRTKWSTLG